MRVPLFTVVRETKRKTTQNGSPIFTYGMCFFDVAVPGGWYKGYESQVWLGVWLGGMIRGMARAPLNSCFVALDTAKLPCAGNWIAVRIWTA